MISTRAGNIAGCFCATAWPKAVGVNALKTRRVSASLFTPQPSPPGSLQKSVYAQKLTVKPKQAGSGVLHHEMPLAAIFDWTPVPDTVLTTLIPSPATNIESL